MTRDLEREIWAEDGWESGIKECLAQILPTLRPALELGLVVLDLGCGIGRLAIALAERFPEAWIIGLDTDPDMLAEFAVRGAGTRVEALLGDGFSLPSFSQPLAGAFSVLCFQHIPSASVRSYLAGLGDQMMPGARFRFQWVPDADEGPYSHGHAIEDVREWCRQSGLRPGRLKNHPGRPTWQWATATKI